MAVTKESMKKATEFFIGQIKQMTKDVNLESFNVELYQELFDNMSLEEFQRLVEQVERGEQVLSLFSRNLKSRLSVEGLEAYAEKLGLRLRQRLILTDPLTGRKYKTPESSLVLRLPVRRQAQHLTDKISLPESTRVKDQLTGQVTGESKGASVTDPESNVIASKGFKAALIELIKVRGGDEEAYQDFLRQIEETGEVNLGPIMDLNSKPAVIDALKEILRAMDIGSTL